MTDQAVMTTQDLIEEIRKPGKVTVFVAGVYVDVVKSALVGALYRREFGSPSPFLASRIGSQLYLEEDTA